MDKQIKRKTRVRNEETNQPKKQQQKEITTTKEMKQRLTPETKYRTPTPEKRNNINTGRRKRKSEG